LKPALKPANIKKANLILQNDQYQALE